jgi:hypothetical protein
VEKWRKEGIGRERVKCYYDLFDVCPCEKVDNPGHHLPPVLQVSVKDAGDLLLEVDEAGKLVDCVPGKQITIKFPFKLVGVV